MPRIGSHPAARCRRAREAFREIRGAVEEGERERQIAALESKTWNGTRVYRLACEGPYGRGPHVVFVPEMVCWSLIDLRHFLCPFHR